MKRLRTIVLVALLGLGACKEFLPTLDDPEMADLNARLSKCRAEARAFVQTSAEPHAKETGQAAYMKYEDCKRREHIEGVDAK